jgi:hypothetical protein
MFKLLRFVLSLLLLTMLAACAGSQAPAQENKTDQLSTAMVETATAGANSTLSPEAIATQQPPSSTQSPVATDTTAVTGPQYGPTSPAALPAHIDYLGKAAPIPRQTAVPCKADAAAMKALINSASWSGDLTNDGQADYITISAQEIAIQSCGLGNLNVIGRIPVSSVGQAGHLLVVQDLNQNAIPEVVLAIDGVIKPWTDGAPHISDGMLGSDIVVLEWTGAIFSRTDLFVPVMTSAAFVDTDGNGTQEIVATSDFKPKTDKEYTLYWDVYPWRKTVNTYARTENGYAIKAVEKGPAEYSSQLMAEARETTDYATLLKIYEQVIETPGLKGWTPEMEAYKAAMAKYYQGGQKAAAPVAPTNGADVVIADQAWAHYFSMLQATAHGDLDLAKLHYSNLQSQLAGADSAKPVIALAAAFWNEYTVSQDISQACYQARLFAVQRGWGEAASGCFFQEMKAPLSIDFPALPATRAANQAPLTVLPGQSDISALPSIWDVLNITNLDLSAPGVRSFDQALPQNEPVVWPFFWCANDNPAILQRNLDNISVYFLINGERVPDEFILKYHLENSAQQCQYWATILRDWQPGSSVKLEIVYQFRTAVFDGSSRYPAGEYRYGLTAHLP